MLESRTALRRLSGLAATAAILAPGCERDPASTAGSTRVRRVEVTVVEEVRVDGPAAVEEVAPWRDGERTLLLLAGAAADGERRPGMSASDVPCCIASGSPARTEPPRHRGVWRARRLRVVAEERITEGHRR